MSSPFSLIRKYQGMMLAIFGVMLMFAFTIAPIINRYGGNQGGGGGEDPTVVSWKHGTVGEREIQDMRARRSLLIQLFQAAYQTAQMKAGAEQIQPKVAQIPTTITDRSVIQTMLMSRQAEDLGLRLSDESLFNYVSQFTGDELDVTEVKALFEQVAGERITRRDLLDALRREVLSLKMLEIATSSIVRQSPSNFFIVATPAEAWQYHQRLNRQVEAELIPFNVQDFVSTDEPPAKALQDLYDEYKTQYSFPLSPDPGFKQRRKIAFQFIRADYDTLLTAAKEKVSQEDVETYYEEHKDSDYTELPSASIDDLGFGADTDSEPDGAAGTGEATADDGSPETDQPEATTDADETAPVEDPASDLPEQSETNDGEPTEEPDNGAATDEAPTDEAPTDEAPTDEAPTIGAEPATDEPTDTPEDEPASEEPPVEEPESDLNLLADDPTDTGEKSNIAPPDDAQETPDVETNEESNEQPDTAEVADSETTDAETASTETAATETTDTEPLPVQYQALEKVEDDIRGKIAAPGVQAAIDKTLASVRSKVASHFDAHRQWEFAKSQGDKKENDKPAAPDFTDINAMDGFAWVKFTSPLDFVEISRSEDEMLSAIAKSSEKQPGFDAQGRPQELRFIDLLFDPAMPLFRTGRSDVQDQQSFLFWKTDEKKEYVPDLEEAKPAVIQAWRMREARSKAEAAAKKIVDLANSENKTFKETDPATAVIETGEISFYDQISVIMSRFQGSPLQLSTIEAVKDPGFEFMKKLFAEEAGKATTIFNQPKTIVYAARIKKKEGGLEAVQLATDHTKFLDSLVQSAAPGGGPPPDGMPMQLMQMTSQDRMLIVYDWLRELKEEMKLKWVREPDSTQ